MSVWVFSSSSSFLPQSKDMQLLTEDCKLMKVNGLYLYRASLVLMTTQSALQYSLPFTHSHTHLYSASFSSSFFYEGQFGVQHLAQEHFGMQMGKTGIELPTFWLEDDRSATATPNVSLNGCLVLCVGPICWDWLLPHIATHKGKGGIDIGLIDGMMTWTFKWNSALLIFLATPLSFLYVVWKTLDARFV